MQYTIIFTVSFEYILIWFCYIKCSAILIDYWIVLKDKRKWKLKVNENRFILMVLSFKNSNSLASAILSVGWNIFRKIAPILKNYL